MCQPSEGSCSDFWKNSLDRKGFNTIHSCFLRQLERWWVLTEGPQYGTWVCKPGLNDHNSVYLGNNLAIFSVELYFWRADMNLFKNSEVAFICICFLSKRYLETTNYSDLAKPIHSLLTIKWQKYIQRRRIIKNITESMSQYMQKKF